MTTQGAASKSRVPAYGLSDSGAPVPSVSSRIAWMKRKGFGKEAHRQAAIDLHQKSAKTEREWVRQNIEQIGVDFDSPDFDLSMLKARLHQPGALFAFRATGSPMNGFRSLVRRISANHPTNFVAWKRHTGSHTLDFEERRRMARKDRAV
jgi:hypothetical protein